MRLDNQLPQHPFMIPHKLSPFHSKHLQHWFFVNKWCGLSDQLIVPRICGACLTENKHLHFV
jgi:hypothetical protein